MSTNENEGQHLDAQDDSIERAQADAMREIEGLIGEIEGIRDDLRLGGEELSPEAIPVVAEAEPTVEDSEPVVTSSPRGAQAVGSAPAPKQAAATVDQSMIDQLMNSAASPVEPVKKAEVPKAAPVVDQSEIDRLLNGVDDALREAQQPPDVGAPPAAVAEELAPPAEEVPSELNEFRASGTEEFSLEDSVGGIEPEAPAEGGLLSEPSVASTAENVVPAEVPRPVHREQHVSQSQVGRRDAPRDRSSSPAPSAPRREHQEKRRTTGSVASLSRAGSRMERQLEKKMKSSSTESPEGVLKMTLSGAMRLALVYEAEGRAVTVSFDDGFLKVELTDGTEFRIPLSRASSRVEEAGFDEEEEFFEGDENAA